MSILRCGLLALAGAGLAACAVPDADKITTSSAAIDQPPTTGNSVQVLRDGDQTFAAIGMAISQARRVVNLEYYTIEDVTLKTTDGNPRSLADMLVAKRQQGVAVNIIYDSYGSSDTPNAFFDRLRRAGVTLLDFHPVNPLPTNVLNGNNRDHRKILVADNAVAIIGGVNLSKSYESKSPGSDKTADPTSSLPARWRDTAIRIEGPAVQEIQRLFDAQWVGEGGVPLGQAADPPSPRTKNNAMVRILGSTPREEVSRYYVTIVAALRQAKSSAWISAAYFVPTPEEMEVLIDAAKRGVDVRLLLPAKSDSTDAIEAAQSHYSDLLRAGVKIYEMQNVVLHSKTVVIDGAWSAIGSSNFDHRSVLFNDEIDAVVIGRETAQELEAIFQEGEQTASAIDRRSWEAQRSFPGRVRGFLTQLWEGLL